MKNKRKKFTPVAADLLTDRSAQPKVGGMSIDTPTFARPPSRTFRLLLWLIPIFFTIHNLEEARGMARWAQRHFADIMLITREQMLTAIALVTLVGWLLTALCWSAPRRSVRLHLLLGAQAILFFNVFFHVGGAIITAGYAPGMVTAILLELPLSLILFRRARQEEILTRRGLLAVLAGGLLAYGPAVWLAMLFGRWVTWNI